MALTIRISGNNVNFAPNSLGLLGITKLRNGLLGEYNLTGVSNYLKNITNPSLPLIENGSPINTASGRRVDSTDYFDTGIKESENMTMIVVGFSADTRTFSTAVSNYSGNNPSEASGLFFHPTNNAYVLQTHHNAGTQVTMSAPTTVPSGEYKFIAARIGNGADYEVKVDEYKDNVLTSKHSTMDGLTRSINTEDNLTLGGGFAAYATLAAVLIYDRQLSDSEIENVYLELKFEVSKVGISI